jgi:hypothetical protein
LKVFFVLKELLLSPWTLFRPFSPINCRCRVWDYYTFKLKLFASTSYFLLLE